MTHRDFFYKFIKPRLVEMAIDCSLPSDMNELQFEDLTTYDFDEEQGHTADGLAARITKLGKMISVDSDNGETLSSAYNKLLAQKHLDGNVMADEVVTMWEPFENKLTVSELMESL